MSKNWFEQIQNVKQASTSINLTKVARDALSEIYLEVQSQGMLSSLSAAIDQGMARVEVLECAAYLLTQHRITDVDEAIKYYQSIADVVTQYPDLIYVVNRARLTSFKNVDVDIPIDRDFQAAVGLMLAEGYPRDAHFKLESAEGRVPQIKEMLRLLDNEQMAIQRTISLDTLRRNVIEAPYAPERPAHLELRQLAFNGANTSSEESREMLESVIKRLLGLKPPKPADFSAELERLELNPIYLQKYLQRDYSFMLPQVHKELGEEDSTAEQYLSRPETLEIFNQFRAFLAKHGMDGVETVWTLYANKTPSQALECAERHPLNRDYASQSMLEMLTEADKYGGVEGSQGVFATQWLKSLAPDEALALKLEDKCILKLYAIRGEKALLRNVKAAQFRDQAIGMDLGL